MPWRAIAATMLVLGATTAAACGSDESRDGTVQNRAAQEKTVILEMDQFTLEPHSDGFICQSYQNPFGADVRLTGWEFQSGSGSAHHLLVFPEEDGQAKPVYECEMNAQNQIILGSQAPDDIVSYPDGVGTAVPGSIGLRMRIHYDNRADTPEDVDGPRLKIRYVEPDQAPQPTGLYSFTDTDILVPAGQAGSGGTTVPAPRDMELVWMVSHYHDHGQNFTASVREEEVYTSGDVNNPQETLVFDPPLLVKKGEPITFQCNYQADPDRDLVFGGSLKDQEMCNLKGGYILPEGGVPEPLVGGAGAAPCQPAGATRPPTSEDGAAIPTCPPRPAATGGS